MSESLSMADYIAIHEELFAHYNQLCGRLTEDDLAIESLCPGWDVRTVISHTIGVDHILDGWAPSTEKPPPFQNVGSFQAALADLAPAEFAARIAETTASRLDHLRSLDPSAVEEPSLTPAGVGTYGRFLQVRVFDLWVHALDVAIPMGEGFTTSAQTAASSLQEVVDSVGYIVGKKIGLPEGRSILFHIEGDGGRDLVSCQADPSTMSSWVTAVQ